MTANVRIEAGWLRWLPLALAGLSLLAGALALRGSEPAKAIAPCVPWTNTADELEFLGQLQTWRDGQFGAGSKQLVRSGPLNAAAAGYAQFLAQTGGHGHFADGSDMWARAENCGFTTDGNAAYGGEGLGRGPTAGDALAMMISEPGSGVYYPNADCVGIAKAGEVWIVLLMRRFGSCPDPLTGGVVETVTPPTATNTSAASATPTNTSTPTNTATPTATPSPTATPDPRPFRAFAAGVCADCD